MDANLKPLSGTYTALSHPYSIRLLELEPAVNDHEPLRGSLIVTTLEEVMRDVTMRYTALSYVWGNPALSGSIVLSGCNVGITANLAQALTDIRHTSRVSVIWADALCIDQQDNRERRHQVGIMGNIYRLATSTIIYLGPLMPNSLCLFNYITAKSLERLRSQSLGIPQRHTSSSNSDLDSGLKPFSRIEEDSLTSCVSEPDPAQLALAIDEICSSDWFTRAWVFQELVLSSDPRIQCGRMLARWSDMADVVAADTKTGQEDDTAPEQLRRNVFLEMNKASNAKGKNTLSNLIRARAGARVTDPRDFFYCLMGIADDRQEWEGIIQMDYDVPVRSLYTLVAREMFYRDEISLGDILAHKAANQEIAVKDDLFNSSLLPGWVPGWNVMDCQVNAECGGNLSSNCGSMGSPGVLNNVLVIPLWPKKTNWIEKLTGPIPVQPLSKTDIDQLSRASSSYFGFSPSSYEESRLSKDLHYMYMEISREQMGLGKDDGGYNPTTQTFGAFLQTATAPDSNFRISENTLESGEQEVVTSTSPVGPTMEKDWADSLRSTDLSGDILQPQTPCYRLGRLHNGEIKIVPAKSKVGDEYFITLGYLPKESTWEEGEWSGFVVRRLDGYDAMNEGIARYAKQHFLEPTRKVLESGPPWRKHIVDNWVRARVGRENYFFKHEKILPEINGDLDIEEEAFDIHHYSLIGPVGNGWEVGPLDAIDCRVNISYAAIH